MNSISSKRKRRTIQPRWAAYSDSSSASSGGDNQSLFAPLLTLCDVGCDDPLAEAEDVRIVRIDGNLDPMMVWTAEGLDPREVFECGKAGLPPYSLRSQRLVDPEEVAVAVD